MTKHRGLSLFLITSILLVSLAVFVSIQVSKTQSGMRAFVNEEGTWAKAHRDAMLNFRQYLQSNAEHYLQEYNQTIFTNIKIIEAKQDLDNGNYQAAHDKLVLAGCHPENISEVVYLYKNYSWLGTFQHAMGIWDQANIMVQELDSYIQRYVTAENANEKNYILGQINYTQQKMIQAEKAFEKDFIILAQWANVFLTSLSAFMYLFIAIGLFLVIRRTMNQLTEKEEFYDAAFNQSRIAYIQYTLDGRIIAGNQRFAEMIKTNTVTLKGLNFFDLIRKTENPIQGQTLDNQRTQVFEFVFNYNNENEKHYKANTTTIHNYSGTPLYCVAAIDDITKEIQLKLKLEKQARHDFLTGLLNKRAFENILSVFCKEKTIGYVLFMDLNQFKQVNDVAGHHAGDLVLKQASQRINNISGLHYFFRIGGDEFAAFIKEKDMDNVLKIADAICDCIAQRPFEYEGNQFNLSISVGISQSTELCQDKKELMKQADAACYLSKKHQKVMLYQQWASKA